MMETAYGRYQKSREVEQKQSTIVQDMYYEDVDDSAELNLFTEQRDVVFIRVTHDGESAAINLSKEDALDMAHRIINRFKVEQNAR